MHSPLIVLLFAGLATLAGCKTSSPTHEQSNSMGTAVADPHTAVLTVHGMGCPQCANNVDSQLMKVPGVESVSINMGSGRVLAKLSPSNHPTRDQLAKAIGETGFTLVKIDMPR